MPHGLFAFHLPKGSLGVLGKVVFILRNLYRSLIYKLLGFDSLRISTFAALESTLGCKP